MLSSHHVSAVVFAGAALVFAAPAFAQAPINYVGRAAATSTAPAADARSFAALAGGGSNSYGYGAQRAQAGGEGILDLRRPSTPRRIDPDLTVPPQDSPEVQEEDASEPTAAQAPAEPLSIAAPAAQPGRPDWLETERVGPPYEANGQWYAPTAEPGYAREGLASWYGPDFHGRQTASGEIYDQTALTAAHPTLPLNSLVQVTNLENGREAILRVNDRGPFVGDRLIDVSRGAADSLGFAANGTARVHVRYLGPAPRRVGEGASVAAAPATVQTVAYQAPVTALTPRAGLGAYVIQIGAFSDRANAQRAGARAEAAGPVDIAARGSLYRVRVGAFASRAEAEAALEQLADLGFPDAIVAGR